MAKLGIVIAGGDNCANNAIVHYVAKHARNAGFTEIYGARYGNFGLLHREFVRVLADQINPDYSSSVIIGVSRTPIWYKTAKDIPESSKGHGKARQTELHRENASRLKSVRDTLDVEGIQNLVYIGGEGTLLCAKALAEALPEIRVLYVPSSMDCDVYTKTQYTSKGNKPIEIPFTLGYSSAVQKIEAATDEVICLAEATQRVLFVSTFGGERGHVACATSLGGANIVVVPEIIDNFYKKANMTKPLAEKIEQFFGNSPNRTYPHTIVGIFEGTPVFDEDVGEYVTPAEMGYYSYGKRLTGAQSAYIMMCKKQLSKRGKDIAMVTHNTDYRPKIGIPSSYDKVLAEKTALRIVQLLEQKERSCYPTLASIVGIEELSRAKDSDLERIFNNIRFSQIDEGQRPVGVPIEFLNGRELTTSDVYKEFARKITGEL